MNHLNPHFTIIKSLSNCIAENLYMTCFFSFNKKLKVSHDIANILHRGNFSNFFRICLYIWYKSHILSQREKPISGYNCKLVAFTHVFNSLEMSDRYHARKRYIIIFEIHQCYQYNHMENKDLYTLFTICLLTFK